MKTKLPYFFIVLALLIGATTQLFAQDPAFTYQGRLNDGSGNAATANRASATVAAHAANSGSVVSMSIPFQSSGNEWIDMMVATNLYDGELGFSHTDNSGLPRQGVGALWWADGVGLGSNVWGSRMNFYGGITAVGNPYWRDLPVSDYRKNMGFYWGYGPQASTFTNTWPNGQGTNKMNYQPGLNIANANPWGGGAYLNIVTSYTNASHGYLVGTNADGVPIYMPQWGLQVFPVSDAYSMDGTAAGAEAQQAPSYVLDLLNDWGLVSYISINGRRAGDIYNGQVPLLAIDPTTSSHIKFRVPLQVSNVWITSNPNWKDAFVVDENTGAASFGGTITGNGSGLTNLSANAIADGLTTNFAVLVPGGGTNTLCFTNGILRAVQ